MCANRLHRSSPQAAARSSPGRQPRRVRRRTVVIMHEVLPGVFHWTAVHPKIHIEVSSYWLEDGGVLIDPLVPPDVGVDWFAHRSTPPAAVLLSNRHHYRDSSRFAEVFGCPVLCNRAGLHE